MNETVATITEFKSLVTRLENASFQEAECEFRDLPFTTAKRRAENVNEARRNLMDAIERLLTRTQSPQV